MAANNWRWESDAWLSMVLTIFIVEVLWSTWRAGWLDVDWASLFTVNLESLGDASIPGIPYTTPWSPLGRFLGRLRQTRHWLHEDSSAEQRGALLTLPILPPLILLLSAVIGWQMLVLSLAALSLSMIEWRVARWRCTHAALQAGLEIGLSWLAGHTVFGPLSWTSFTLACCYAIAYQGILSFDQARRSWSLSLFYGGQAAAAILLALLRSSSTALVAVALGMLLAPQWLLLVKLEMKEQGLSYLKRTVPFFMVAMAIAAWAV
jgi:hypothetical protein